MPTLGHVLAGDMLGTQGAELPEGTQELGHLAGPLDSSPAQPPPPAPPLPEPHPPPTQVHRPNPGMPSPPFPPACGPPHSRVGFAILALKSKHLPTFQAATSVPVTSAWAQEAAAASQLASYLHLPATARSLGPSQSAPTLPSPLLEVCPQPPFAARVKSTALDGMVPEAFLITYCCITTYPKTRDFRQPFY